MWVVVDDDFADAAAVDEFENDLAGAEFFGVAAVFGDDFGWKLAGAEEGDVVNFIFGALG